MVQPISRPSDLSWQAPKELGPYFDYLKPKAAGGPN